MSADTLADGAAGGSSAADGGDGKPTTETAASDVSAEEPAPPNDEARSSASEGAGDAGAGADASTAPVETVSVDAEVAPADGPSGGQAQPADEKPSKPLTWAQRAARDVAAHGSGAGYGGGTGKLGFAVAVAASSEVNGTGAVRAPRPKARDTILDCLLHLAERRRQDAECAAGEGENQAAQELPDQLRKYESALTEGASNLARATHSRLGITNPANNCYANVVIQSLLPCAAFLWLLRHCDVGDADRPFYACLVMLCKEFHTRKDAHGQVFNMLAQSQFKNILSNWQKLGAQQDAGEFFFYLLNGLHEECKWKIPDSSTVGGSSGSTAGADEASEKDGEADAPSAGSWAHLAKTGCRKQETRTAGLHEDSPIVRIFGGSIQSAVRSKSAKADSVSLEPFNHLDLDISQPNVKCIRTALDAFCSPEAVSDGEATRRLKFKTLPKVLILNLKRFTYDKVKKGTQKVKKPIKFDERFKFERGWLADDTPPPEYVITAVICHHGDSAGSGHYTASVRYNNEWYMYDDSSVRQMQLREVGAQQSDAYLLVYQLPGKVDLRP